MNLAKSTRWTLTAAAVLACAATAWAAEGGGSDKASEVVFLVQLAVLIFFGRVLGEAMQRIGQPTVMGQLVGGLLLGPSVLGLLWPDAQHALFPSSAGQKAMLDGVSQFGVLMLLLLAGMETDLQLVRRIGRAAFSVSLTGIVLPFGCGFILGEFLPDWLLPKPDERLIAALFLGTALSISSVKIVAMVVREMEFLRRNVGQVILASAVIDDTVGWIIIAITFSLAESGSIDAASLARSIIGTLAFIVISLTIGRRLVFWMIRWVNDSFVSEVPVISLILLLMIGMALITQAIGVHTVLGAFIAGILVGESPILTRRIDYQLRGVIVGLFAPVFFGTAGLSADLTILGDMRLLGLTAGLVAIASIGKFAGAFAGGEIGGLTRSESLALASGMNARGSTEVIVATIGLSMGVLSQDLFTMIVAMAVITTLAMPPMLRWSLGRLPLGAEEKARLEREEIESKGFLPNVERLLLAVDDSSNGAFAAHLTGLIAGSRGIPTTVLRIGIGNGDGKGAEPEPPETPEEAVKSAAEAARQDAGEDTAKGNPKPEPVPVTTVEHDAPERDVIAEEARKGYDMLILGEDKTATAKSGFHPRAARAVAGFEGTVALTVGRGRHLEHPEDARLRIILPVNGTEASRRATEIAVALARGTGVGILALYVASREAKNRGRIARLSRRHEEAILREVVKLAEQYDTRVRTKVCVDVGPDDAILRESSHPDSLIVMGVNRRPGKTLYFGDTAASVLARAKASILFVAV
ncbi:MAG TPA: cation:proton antiporter [Alphaproteobacteria bacterium]|nr:cation:proton antiporter [Alphaproteobacteria bacterium]